VWASSPLDQAEVNAAATKLAAAATEAPFVEEQPEVQYAPDGRTAIVALPITGEPSSAAALTSLVDLRDRLVPAAFAGVTDGGAVTVGVTGDVASNADFSDAIAKRLPWVMAFVLLLTFVILLVAFRSLVIAATAVVLNLISVAAAYGILVLVFQNTWAESLLGFRSNGGIVPWLPLFMFVVLFGLSMDYHVFVVSRIREAAHRGMSTIDAIRHGVTSSAGVITSAALIMVGVFAIFGTLSLLDFKQLGVGLAVAVIIDATIVRGVLLPAAMAVLGERNWYLPQFLQRLPELEATIEPAASRDADLQTVR
jgi:RND superfamily putative drug exporter